MFKSSFKLPKEDRRQLEKLRKEWKLKHDNLCLPHWIWGEICVYFMQSSTWFGWELSPSGRPSVCRRSLRIPSLWSGRSTTTAALRSLMVAVSSAVVPRAVAAQGFPLVLSYDNSSHSLGSENKCSDSASYKESLFPLYNLELGKETQGKSEA